MLKTIYALLLVLLVAGCATRLPPVNSSHTFDFAYDTFAFPNETVWRYDDGRRVTESTLGGTKVDRYSRRCFVMAAAIVQFWKFARFEPQAPKVSSEELATRIRRVRNIATWAPALPAEKQIVFPGYASFRDMSECASQALRANLGAGWTTYFQVRKYSMPFVPSAVHQQRMNDQIRAWIARGQPMVLWLYNFPNVNINHAVTVFAEAPSSEGQCVYHVYDPNYTDRPRVLTYNPLTRQFSYEKTFYFEGGLVHVRPMYRGLFQ